MMGFGSMDYGGGGVGGGGSSSSFSSTSNLSPLAPPFTIDSSQTNPKSKPYRLDQFPVEDPYAFSSYSSPHSNNWLHLHPPPPTSPLSDSFSNPNLEFDPICAPGLAPNSSSASNNNSYSYGQHTKPYYYDGLSMGNLGGGANNVIPILSPPATSVTATSSFPHVQHLEKVANNFVNEVSFEPYYPQTQYPSTGIGEKRNSPSVVIRKPDGSDLLTMPNVTLGGYSGLGYAPSWGGLWGRTSEWEEQGKRKEPDGVLSWMENVVAGSSTNKSFLKEGAPNADGGTASGEASGVLLGKSAESLTGKYHVGPRDTDLLNAKCSSSAEENATLLCNMPRQSMFSSSTIFPEMTEMPYPEEPYRGWSQLNANNNSFNRCFSPPDSCIGDPTVFYPSTAFSLGATSKPPTIGKSYLASKKSTTSANVNSTARVGNVFGSNENLAGYTPSTSNIKDPFIQLSAERKESVADISNMNNEMDRIDSIFTNSSSLRKDIPSDHSPIVDNSWDRVFNRKQEQQVNQFSFYDTSTLASVAAAAAAAAATGDPVESSLETFDQFNSAVDSPCWKGAPAFRSSPFASKEAGPPQLLVKELAGCNGLKFQGPQVLPVNDDDTVAISSPEHENPSSNENAHAGDGNLLSSSPKASLNMSNKNGVKFSFGCQEPVKECFLPDESQFSSRLKPFQMMQPSNEKDNVPFTGQLASECRVAESGIDAKNAPQYGSSPVPINAKLRNATSPSSGVHATIEHGEPLGEGSDTSAKKLIPKLDARLLVNAMHNLSELLLASCSNGVDVLEEQDHEILQHVTNNLQSCVSMKFGLTRPPLESHYPQSVNSYCDKKVPDPHKGVAAGKSQVTREKASVIQSHCDNQAALEGGMSSNLCSEKQDIFQDFASQNSDTDFEKDNGMTQRIKKLLKENDDDDDEEEEEELLPKIQLYKNLWLEAEAALCCMKYNTRFASMKIEMEKYKLLQGKESYVAGKSINVEEQSSSKVSSDENSPNILSPNIKQSLNTKISKEEDVEASVMARLHILKDRLSTKNSTQEASQLAAANQEDVEASVMARLHILRCRVDNSSSMSTERRQPVGSIDEGNNAEAVEKASSPGGLSVKNVGMKTRPNQVVDMGFAGRSKLWPVSSDESEDGISDVKNIPDVQHKNANYTNEDELVLDQDVPEQVMIKDYRVCVPDEPIIQSYISDRFGKRLPAGGYDSPSSSDWEHVLKDELTWQN